MLDVVAGSRALAAVGRQARVAAGRRELQCGITVAHEVLVVFCCFWVCWYIRGKASGRFSGRNERRPGFKKVCRSLTSKPARASSPDLGLVLAGSRNDGRG